MTAQHALNTNSPLPLYQQLAERLAGEIRAGVYPSGSKLPSEPSLAKTYRIGRPTVRQATELLVRRQLVRRRRGAGTFVLEAPASVDLFSLAGTLASFELVGIALETRLVKKLSRARVEDDPHNPFQGREVYSFSRLCRVRRRPVLFEALFLDPALFPDLERFNLEGASLSRIVKRDYFRAPTSATQHFSVECVSADLGTHLKLHAGSSILMVRRHLHFGEAKSAIFSKLYCKTGDFVFSQTIGAEHGKS